ADPAGVQLVHLADVGVAGRDGDHHLHQLEERPAVAPVLAWDHQAQQARGAEGGALLIGEPPLAVAFGGADAELIAELGGDPYGVVDVVAGPWPGGLLDRRHGPLGVEVWAEPGMLARNL